MAALDFVDVFRAEAEAVNARRAKLKELYPKSDPPLAGGIVPDLVVETTQTDERGCRKACPRRAEGPSGLALSGGGIRSAAFCLGVLQGMDARKPNGTPQLLDGFDYLSTVSGGGFIGIALTSGIMQSKDGAFPFESKLDEQETIEVQHIRDFSNYLMPKGGRDLVIGLVAILRGLLVNAVVFLAAILAFAAFTVGLSPHSDELLRPWGLSSFWHGFPFVWTGVACAVFFLTLGLSPLRSPFLDEPGPRLSGRETLRLASFLLALALVLVGLFDAQGYVLSGIFDLTADPMSGNPVTRALHNWGEFLARGWAAILTSAVGLIGSASKLTGVVRATVGDQSWNGTIKRWASFTGIYLVALTAPLLIWSVYILFSHWGIESTPIAPDGCGLCNGQLTRCHAPTWLRYLTGLIPSDRPYVVLYATAAISCAVLSLFVRPNAGSLHGYYRDRLSRAFLWQRDHLAARARNAKPSSAVTDVDSFKFSSLGKRKETGGTWGDAVRYAPFLLVNAAVNLEGSEYLNRRGRNADNFVFSPLHAGSEATGYTSIETLETIDPHVNLATAMAASGAAASANMGASTIRALTFTLSAANVRLGYWLPNPGLIDTWNGKRPLVSKIGPAYFLMELSGSVRETTKNVYLTDGGHFDNLGLYELLKRRCAVIVAVDAEADPPLNFDSLIRLQRYARIDLGVRIDLPWEDIRRFSRKITLDFPHGPLDDAAHCHGPHAAIGRIVYGPGESGVLIYIKATMSGDENDLVRDYKRRNVEFPNETTVDQFFSEEQFEVYRTLGFHAADSLFSGTDRFGLLRPDDNSAWTNEVAKALRRINLATEAVDKIVYRQKWGRFQV